MRAPAPAPAATPLEALAKRARVKTGRYDPSQHWSEYDIERVGSRHSRVHAETRDELLLIFKQLKDVMAILKADSEHDRSALQALQRVLLEVLLEDEDEDDDDDDDRPEKPTSALRGGTRLSARVPQY